MVTEPLPQTVISCVVRAMRENRFLLFLNHLRLAYSNLKSFALILNIHIARHTWATIASELDIPKDTISAALGHGGNSVTDIYINFDQRKVDEANRKVLDYVLYDMRN